MLSNDENNQSQMNDDELIDGEVLENVSNILPKTDLDQEKKPDIFKNFDKIESEFDTLD